MNLLLSNGATIMVVVLLVLVIAYRYYSAFLAAKVMALDPNRPTPARSSWTTKPSAACARASSASSTRSSPAASRSISTWEREPSVRSA